MVKENLVHYLVSKKAQYAVRAMFELAAHKQSSPVSGREIAEVQGIPLRFLEIILNRLKSGNFVISTRGKQGGYLLSRRPEEITLGQITQFIDAVSGKQNRSSITTDVLRRGDFSLRWAWDSIESAVSQVLDNITLRDLVDREMQFSDAYSSSYII